MLNTILAPVPPPVTLPDRPANDAMPVRNRAGFPAFMLPLLRCVADGGELTLARQSVGTSAFIEEGVLRCLQCSHQYPIEGGIVRMLPPGESWETEHEIQLKDEEYEAMPDRFIPPDSGWRSEFMDHIEIPPHLAAVAPLDGRQVLEVGCGDGRFTSLMAQSGASVLAMDLSLWGLRKAQRNLIAGEPPTVWRLPHPRRTGSLAQYVGLVQADASRLSVAPRSFHRVLSATPLDSREERMKMFAAVAECLTDDGRCVAGVEHDDLYRRLLGLSVLRRYSPGGILIEHLHPDTLQREMAPFFDDLKMRPIRARLPLAGRLPLKARIAAARAAAALPLLRSLGEILLGIASHPRRLPEEGVRRAGHLGAARIYRRIKRWSGEDAVWTLGDGRV